MLQRGHPYYNLDYYVFVCVFDSVYQQAAVITALVFSVSATAIDCQLSTVLCLSLFLSV